MNWLKIIKKSAISSLFIMGSAYFSLAHAGGHGWGNGGHGGGWGHQYSHNYGRDCGHNGYNRGYYRPRFIHNNYNHHGGYAYNQPVIIVPPVIHRPHYYNNQQYGQQYGQNYGQNYGHQNRSFGNQGRLGIFFESGF
jgi:hypothetical protein